MAHIPPQGFKRLAGSERKLPTNAHMSGPVDPNKQIEVSIYLRDPSPGNLAGDINGHGRQPGQRITRAEFSAQHSASPDDLAYAGAV